MPPIFPENLCTPDADNLRFCSCVVSEETSNFCSATRHFYSTENSLENVNIDLFLVVASNPRNCMLYQVFLS